MINENFIKAVFTTMKAENKNSIDEIEELPDAWWYRVYLAVIITTILVIAALWAFSLYFSN